MITDDDIKLNNLKDLGKYKGVITTNSSKEVLSHEQSMLKDGYDRFHKNWKRNEKTIPALNIPIRNIFETAIEKTTKAIKAKIAEDNSQKGRKKKYLEWVQDLKIAEIALLVLNECWKASQRQNGSATTAASAVGDAIVMMKIEKSIKIRQNDEQIKQLKRLKDRAKKKHSNPEGALRMFKSLVKSASKNDKKDEEGNLISALYGFEIPEPSDEFKTDLGFQVIYPAINATNIFKMEVDYSRGKTKGVSHIVTKDVLTITDEASELVKKEMESQEWQKPKYEPLTEKPDQLGRTKFTTSGYHHKDIKKTLKPVKRMKRLQTKAINQAISDGSMDTFWKGANFIQNTAFKIDKLMYDIVSYDVINNLGKGEKFPHIHKVKILSPNEWADEKGYPHHNLWSNDNHKLYNNYKNEAEKFNRICNSNAQVWKSDTDTIKKILNYEIFLPVQPDNRGRLYYNPHLNPQREEKTSVLFTFAKGKPLGENGKLELAVNIANLASMPIGKNSWDIPEDTKSDKIADEYKVKWLMREWDWIAQTVYDLPKRSHLKQVKWQSADKPYKFLQAAYELYKVTVFEEEGGLAEDFISHLPITLDSSSSGVQFYACILLTVHDAVLSNLQSEDGQKVANDVYMEIANAVIKKMKQDIIDYEGFEDCDEAEYRKLAQLWLDFGLKRKYVKRPVMTSLYSATLYGFTNQIMKDTIIPLRFDVIRGDIDEHPLGDNQTQFQAARYLAQTIWDALHTVLSEAMKAMNVLRQTAEVMANEGKPVRYTNPTGFPFINEVYTKEKVVAQLYLTDIKLRNIKYQPTIEVETDEISVDESISKICPNFVHSLDSSLLILAILEFEKQGGTSIMVNHDAFSTHACDVMLLKDTLQSTLRNMRLKNNWLKDLIDTNKALADNPELLPEVPAMGDFNLDEILKAPFAFS